MNKESILQKAMRLRQSRLDKKQEPETLSPCNVSDNLCRFDQYESYKIIKQQQTFIAKLDIQNPFFHTHDALASATTMIDGKEFVNFSSYNYLNLNGDTRVKEAAIKAIQHYGTSVSASRLVSGERSIQQQLERALADLHQVDDAIVFVSGHATNVSTIGYLFDEKDLVLHDEYIHDSVRQGIKLSGARHFSFPHNNADVLDKLLHQHRHLYQRVLIVIEGIYSMDGDFPDLPTFVAIKKKHKAFLMVDEAHSVGVMGQYGRGIGEHFGVASSDVDIWMGSLSKTFASCGGYIAGEKALVEHLRYAAPGFLYSVGISPPLTAAALSSLQIMLEEPERISALHDRAQRFLSLAKVRGLDTGLSQGLNIIPIMCGSSRKAVQLSNQLNTMQINVQPIIYPAVPESQARLRFFMNCSHTDAQISETVEKISSLL